MLLGSLLRSFLRHSLTAMDFGMDCEEHSLATIKRSVHMNLGLYGG
jgi:hypothetical protein